MNRRFRQPLRNLLCALATGYILFFFSERLFWAVWPPSDALANVAVTWLAYSAIAYLFLTVVAWSRANDFWSMFLAGAIYGWLVEGGVADTLYGTQPSAPFPMSISLTGLAWHALLSVVVGWWATGRALRAATLWPLALISMGIGLFWGVWAMFLRQETPPVITPVESFFVNAVLLTLGLIAAWWTSSRVELQHFRPGMFGIVFCTFAVGLFYVQHVLRLGLLPLVLLPALLGLALAVLYCHRRSDLAQSSELLFGRLRFSRLAMLCSIPIAATIVYFAASNYGLYRLPIAATCYAIGGPCGIILLIWALVVNFRRAVRTDETLSG